MDGLALSLTAARQHIAVGGPQDVVGGRRTAVARAPLVGRNDSSHVLRTARRVPCFSGGAHKGRLQHALRKASPNFSGFSRKVSVNTVGHNCREDVEAYIASQVDAASFADPSFRDMLKEFTTIREDVDLSLPTESLHGRYWYNLHLVLVNAERYPVVDRRRLGRVHEFSFKIAERKGYKISRLSVMPDHLHAALRGNIEESPQEIALAFQNNLAYARGKCGTGHARFTWARSASTICGRFAAKNGRSHRRDWGRGGRGLAGQPDSPPWPGYPLAGRGEVSDSRGRVC